MSRWRQVVRRELARYREDTGYDVVERQEFLEQALPVLEREFPDNDHPGQKVSQIMQQLGRRNEVEFIDDDGTYRLTALDRDRMADPADATVDPEDATTGSTESEGATGLPSYEAEEYETTVGARSMLAAFRTAILDRYDGTCPVSGVDHDRLLDVAHVPSWSDHPDLRSDPGNVLPLSKTHHAAFDAELFTLDRDYRLRVNPAFETDSDLLRRTLVERDGTRIRLPRDSVLSESYLDRHNDRLDWWPV